MWFGKRDKDVFRAKFFVFIHFCYKSVWNFLCKIDPWSKLKYFFNVLDYTVKIKDVNRNWNEANCVKKISLTLYKLLMFISNE